LDADRVGAVVGETVLVRQGSSGRQTELTKNKAIDAVIMAIVDKLDVVEGQGAGGEVPGELAVTAR